jgi:hypothetical protein
MAAPTLVDRRIEHGARFLVDLDEAGVPIDSAFWLFDSAWDEWRLVIATPVVDESGPVEAYRRLQAVHHADEGISCRLDSISAVGIEDRRVQALRSQFRTWPLSLGKRFEDRFIRGGEIEDSYVYRLSPPPDFAGATTGTDRQVRTGSN